MNFKNIGSFKVTVIIVKVGIANVVCNGFCLILHFSSRNQEHDASRHDDICKKINLKEMKLKEIKKKFHLEIFFLCKNPQLLNMENAVNLHQVHRK